MAQNLTILRFRPIAKKTSAESRAAYIGFRKRQLGATRPECDIRIQLPQVSKEHCKIEVNENKEAILTNLSTVNPTKLNGSCFQQPVPLRHGDVLTIIDRCFRFEYPVQSTPRKRRSRSPKDETLQVLHVQQVAEVELYKQTPGSKSLHASDNAECEENKANENKQSTEESITKALPVKLQTPKSSCKIQQSTKMQYEKSPFSQLYDKLKHDFQVKKSLLEGNVSQRGAKEDGKSVVLEPSAQIPSSRCGCALGSLVKEKEIGRSENTDAGKITDVIISEFNRFSPVGSSAKKSFTRTPRLSVSRYISKMNHLHGLKELSTAGESTGTEDPTKPSAQNGGNAAFSLRQCSIERLDCPDIVKIYSSALTADKPGQTTDMTNASEAEKYVLPAPAPRRKSPRSRFVSPLKETSGVAPGNPDTPKTGRRVSFKRKSFSGALAEGQREDAVCRNDGLQEPPLAEKCLKQRRNSTQHTPRKSVKEDVLKATCDQANLVNSKDGHPETPASNSKSPRRNSRQSKEIANKSVLSETLASDEVTSKVASPASQKSGSGRKRGRPRTSGLPTEKALETSDVAEHDNKSTAREESGSQEELPIKGDHQTQHSEDPSITRPRRLSSKRRSSGSATELKDETVTETSVSGPLAEEESGKRKRVSQKRKSDLLLQPSGKRKRVSFGGHLSPELFDKSLPPNSPLKRGAIPARLSLPFGNSPRAVLKKAQGLKHFAVQELTEYLQKEKMSPRKILAQKSPAASSPASGKATPELPLGSPAPSAKGRFSVAHITTPSPIAEEKEAGADAVNPKEKSSARVKTPKSSNVNQDDKTLSMATPDKLTRSAQLALKVTPMKRRSGAVAAINAKRRSGASSANLLVAKSWAEVVKLGVARPQSKAVKRSVRRGRPLKKTTRAPKTPEKKVKGHVSTGHAESPDTIVVGRAYATRVRTAGRVPKVVKNPVLKLNRNMDESFTGMTEMFQTPENKNGSTFSLATVEKTDSTPTCNAVDISELQTPEESGEMMVSPLNSSDAAEQEQDSPGIYHLLRENESLKSMFDAVSTKTPEKRKTMLEEIGSGDSLSRIPEKEVSQVTSRRKRSTSKQKLEPAEVMSGTKQLLRTPEQRPELVEALSGIKQLMKTPKQKSEPVEVLSGIKQLMKTPKQKPEPAEALSGIKKLMKTPKQKPEPVEVLSGIKQLMKTPKQKPEPAETLSGIKQLMKTPKQKLEPAEVLSGIKQLMKTPKQKPEPAEALSGIKQLMKTPKQKPEPVEVLSGIKQLMKTPKQKLEPVEVLSGIKQLLRTPQQELGPITDELAFRRLQKTPVQGKEAVKDVAGVSFIKKTPRVKSQPVEDMIGVSRIFKTPKEKVEPIEDMFGISRLVKTPREKYQAVDDFVGLQRLLAEPRQKCSDSEVDYGGVTEMFGTPEETKVRSVNVTDSKPEDSASPSTHSNQKHEDTRNISQGEDSQQQESTSEDQSTQRPKRGRSRKTAHPTSAKQCEKDLNLKELQDLGKKSNQEEMGEISTSAAVAKNRGRGRRRNCCIQEEMVSQHPVQEKIETVSVVESHGATQRSGQGKRKEPKELKDPSENPESCGKDSSVLQKEPETMGQILQVYGVLETEGDPTMKRVSASRSTQAENCQVQMGLKSPENKSNEGGVEDSEEMFLSPAKKSRGVKKVENTEPLIPLRRGRRARNDQVKQTASEQLHGTRMLRKVPSAKMIKRDEQTCEQDTEAAPAEEAESKTKLEIKIAEKRVKSLRRARKHSADGKADICGMVLENIRNIQKTEETSADTETQSCIKNEVEVSQGDETENAQGSTTEASPRLLKTESCSGDTNNMAVTALNRSAVQETNRTRRRRGKEDSLEKKTDEFAEDVSNLEIITPKTKSETAMDESSLKDSLGSVCIQNKHHVKDKSNMAAASVPAANSASRAHSRQKRTRNEQGVLKPEPSGTLQENQAENGETARRRGGGRKVTFELEESSSKAVGGKGSLSGDDNGMTCKGGQHEASANTSSQVRRSRRKQVDSLPQIDCSTFMEKQTLSADHCKDEAFVKEEDSALEAAPSSTEDKPLRRGKRQGAAAASQTSRSLSIRTRRGLLEGDDKKMTGREDQNSALGNKALQEKANVSARDKRKKIDLVAEAKSSSSLQRKCGLSDTDDKEERTNEEQTMPLETVSCAKEKPLGRGRRKETALASHTTNYISLRGKRALPADDGREEASKEDQNVPLETLDSSAKENQLRKGRRKKITLLIEATSSAQGKQGLSKGSGRKNNYGEGKKLILENSTPQEKINLSKRNLRQTVTSVVVSSTSLQGLPEDGKNETSEEQQSILSEVAPTAKENLSRVGRKKNISSKSEETSSTILREKPTLPKSRGQKRILKQDKDTLLENNSSQEKTRQLRNKRTKVEFSSEAASSTSVRKSCDLPENGASSESQNGCLTSTGSEKNHQSGEGKGVNPAQQATSTSRKRKCQLPADDLASKKLKSESDDNRRLQKGKRNQTKEELGEEDGRATQTAGGMNRKTRSSSRTSARARK
ncbi:proliferation marker protein Ki-67 [Apus apus]|uniref:proliferation marker protein Ki-67 n=1 Tax=Apus apus TaxID=8895 RepID=UPI0021F8B0C4|nr:proliferation marker protein Ki-67 [Apus apus]